MWLLCPKFECIYRDAERAENALMLFFSKSDRPKQRITIFWWPIKFDGNRVENCLHRKSAHCTPGNGTQMEFAQADRAEEGSISGRISLALQPVTVRFSCVVRDSRKTKLTSSLFLGSHSLVFFNQAKISHEQHLVGGKSLKCCWRPKADTGVLGLIMQPTSFKNGLDSLFASILPHQKRGQKDSSPKMTQDWFWNMSDKAFKCLFRKKKVREPRHKSFSFIPMSKMGRSLAPKWISESNCARQIFWQFRLGIKPSASFNLNFSELCLKMEKIERGIWSEVATFTDSAKNARKGQELSYPGSERNERATHQNVTMP